MSDITSLKAKFNAAGVRGNTATRTTANTTASTKKTNKRSKKNGTWLPEDEYQRFKQVKKATGNLIKSGNTQSNSAVDQLLGTRRGQNGTRMPGRSTITNQLKGGRAPSQYSEPARLITKRLDPVTREEGIGYDVSQLQRAGEIPYQSRATGSRPVSKAAGNSFQEWLEGLNQKKARTSQPTNRLGTGKSEPVNMPWRGGERQYSKFNDLKAQEQQPGTGRFETLKQQEAVKAADMGRWGYQQLMADNEAVRNQRIMNWANSQPKTGDVYSEEDNRAYYAWQREGRNLGMFDEQDDVKLWSDRKLKEVQRQKQREQEEYIAPDQTELDNRQQGVQEQLGVIERIANNGLDTYDREDGQVTYTRKPEDYDADPAKYNAMIYDAIHGEGAYAEATADLDSDTWEQAYDEAEHMWDLLDQGNFMELGSDLRTEEQDILEAKKGTKPYEDELNAVTNEIARREKIGEFSAGDDTAYHDEYVSQTTDDALEQQYYYINHPNAGSRYFANEKYGTESYLAMGFEFMKDVAGAKFSRDENGNLQMDMQNQSFRMRPTDFMSPEMRDTFNSLYNDPETRPAAKEYLDALMPDLYSIWQQAADESDRALASGNYGTIIGASTILENPLASMRAVTGIGKTLLGDEEAGKPWSPDYKWTRNITNERDERGNIWDDKLVEWFGEGLRGKGKMLNGVVYSMADNMVAMGIGGGKAEDISQELVQLVMSGEAMAGEMIEQLDNGKDGLEACFLAVGAGGIEWITEKYSLEALLNVNPKELFGNGRAFARYLGKNFLAEGSEEVASDFLGDAWTTMVSWLQGHKSDIRKEYEALQRQHPDWTEQQLTDAVMRAHMDQYWQSFQAGGLSGFLMSAGRGGIAHVSFTMENRSDARNIYKQGGAKIANVVQAASQVDGGPKYNQTVKEMSAKLDAEGTLSLPDVRKLVTAMRTTNIQIVDDVAKDAMNSAVRDEIRNRMEENGTTASREQIELATQAATEMLTGDGKISGDMRQALKDVPEALNVVEEVSTAGSRAEQAVKDAVKEAEQPLSRSEQALVSEMPKMEARAANVETNAGEQLATAEEIEAAEGERTGEKNEVIADGQIGTLQGVIADKASKNGFKFVVKTGENTRTVDAGDFKATNYETAAIVRNAQVNQGLYSTDYLNKMLVAAANGQVQNVGTFLMDATQIRMAAYLGVEMPKTQIDSKTALDLYQTSLQDQQNARAQATDEASRNALGAGKGRATFNGAEYGTEAWNKAMKDVDARTRDRMDAEAEIARRAGIELEFIDDAAQPDVYGWESGRGITVNIAGEEYSLGKQTGEKHHIGVSFAHEMTHWLQRNSAKGYNRLRRFVLDNLAQESGGYNAVASRVMTVMERRNAAGENIDVEDAISEIVADSCDQILSDEKVIKHIMNTDATLADQIKGFVKDLVARVSKAMTGTRTGASLESSLLLKQANKMAKLWLGAYDEAISGALKQESRNGSRQTEQKRMSRAAVEQKNIEGTSAVSNANDNGKNEMGQNIPSNKNSITDVIVNVNTDADYLAAVERGDINAATEMLMEKIASTEGIIPFKAPHWNAGRYKEISQLIKSNDRGAIEIAAAEMYELVPDNAVLIPMPDHTGMVNDETDTMLLAKEISKLTGRPVVAAIEGRDRESRYLAKKEGRKGVNQEQIGFRQVAEIPEGTFPIFIDNMVGSGVTADAARKALGGGITLAYAKSLRSKGIVGLKNAVITYDTNGNLIPLSQRFDVQKRDVRYSRAAMDEEYMKALKANDTAKMQQLVDQAAKEAGFTEKVYHGTRDFGFTEFDMSQGRSQNTIFVAYDPILASTYTKANETKKISERKVMPDFDSMSSEEFADFYMDNYEDPLGTMELIGVEKDENLSKGLELDLVGFGTMKQDVYELTFRNKKTGEFTTEMEDRRSMKRTLQRWLNPNQENEGIYDLYADPGRQYEIDAKGANWNNIKVDDEDIDTFFHGYDNSVEYRYKTREIAQYAKAKGYDSVRINNVYDHGGINQERDADDAFGDIGIFFYPSQVKSADPVVYDDNGKLIPLSERFNEKKNDIRWSRANVDAQEAALWSAEDEARTEWNRIREENKGLKAETDSWVDRILEAQKAGNEAEVMDEYYEWEKGFTAARAREQEAEQKVKAAHKAVEDYIEQRDVAEEQKKIRESGLSEADYRRKQAVNEFGYTSDFREAGYMLPNGKMLNFTGEKGRHTGSRGQDHRAIETIYASREIERGKAMVAFMTDGNIRVMAETPGIDISSGAEPTREQYAQIRSMARRFAGEEYFNIDFTDERGNTVDTIEYDGRVNPDRIVNDIKTFYRTGSAPQPSVVGQFHYSRANIDRMDVQTWMEGLDEYSLRSEDERELLKSYKNLRMKIKVSQQKQLDYRKKIQRLEASREVLTPAERSELIETRNRLDIEEGKYARLETQLYEVTDSEGYASMMYYQNQVLNDFLYGRTQAQVDQTVSGMLDEVKKMRGEIAKQAEELKALSEDKAVRTVKSRMAQTQLREMAQVLQNELSSRMGLKEVESRLAEIALKNAQGKDVTADCEALARDMADKARGMSDKTEELEAIRGTVFVIGPKQLEELHAMDSTLKEVNQRLRGSGVRVKSGPVSEIERQWRDLRESNMGLPELYAEGDMLETVVSWVESQLNRSAIAEYGGFDASEYMPVVLACATAIQVEALGDETDARQARMLMSDVKALIGKTENIAENMQKLQQRMDALEEAGHRAAGWTGSLSADVNMALEYYNKTARQAAQEERRKVKEELIRSLQSDHAKELVAQEQKFRDLMRQDRDARNLRADNEHFRRQIHTVTRRLAKLLTAETDQKHIPEEAKPLARALVGLIADHDAMALRKITFASKAEIDGLRQAMDAYDKRDGEIDLYRDLDWLVVGTGENQDTEVRDRVIDDIVAIDQFMMEWDNAEGKGVESLRNRNEALKQVQSAVSEIMSIIKRRQEVEHNGKRMLTAEIADQIADGMADKHGTLWTGKIGKGISGAKSGVFFGNMTPEYFFKFLKNKILSDQYEGYHRAENRNGLEIGKAMRKMNQIATETGYSSWDMKKKLSLKFDSGRTVQMTLDEMMSLWATWNREMANQTQENGPEKSFHLTKGGFYVEENKDEGIIGKKLLNRRATRVTEADMQRISGMLTEQQKEFVNRVVEYMSNDMSALGNEASMRMYGIKKYNEKYYFPFEIFSGEKAVKSDAGAQSGAQDHRASKPGWSNRRVNNASNALMIRGFTETATKHIVQMINYGTFAPEIEDMQKIMNQKIAEADGEDGMTQRNLWTMFGDAYGTEAEKYFKKFQEALNGGVRAADKTVKDKLLSVFRKGAVAGSLSVTLQQPLSYIRALNMISPKYLSLAINPKYWAGSKAEMEKYSGVAVIKAMGKFDMGFGSSAIEYISPDAKEGKLKAGWDKLTDATTKLPELADTMTWTRMWTACKLEQQALHPEMNHKSDEFMNMVAERFNDVMRKTQVYDSVLVRSANMRSTSYVMKTLTSFMAEPTLTLNVLYDAAANYTGKERAANIAKAATTFLMSAAAQAVFKALMSTGRSPDKKKTWWENANYRFWYNFINEVNPLQAIPGYKDLVELLKNGELQDDATSVLSKVLKAGDYFMKLVRGEGDWYRNLEDSVGQITQIFTNLPAKNLMRDLRAIMNWINPETYAQRENSGAVLKYQFKDLLFTADNLLGIVNGELVKDKRGGYDTSNTAYYKRIYDAKLAGREEDAANMTEYLTLGKGIKEETVQQKVRTAAKQDENTTAAETADFLMDEGADPTDYTMKQYKEGEISREEAARILKQAMPDKSDDDIWWKLDRADFKKETGEDAGSGKNYRFLYAIENGGSTEIKAAAKLLTDHGVDMKKQRSKITEKFRPVYLEMKPASDEQVKLKSKLIMAYKETGMTESEAEQLINKWKKDSGGIPKGAAVVGSNGLRPSGLRNQLETDSGDRKDTTGRYGKGTIDLNNRQVVQNRDGSISTERSFSFYDEDTGKEVLIPTVVGGRILTEDEAIEHYYDTVRAGKPEYLGMFDTPEEATEYAERLHNRQDWYYHNH